MQEPEMILDRRLKNVGKRTIWQVLVKWLGWPAELATWEEEDEILPKLEAATACGQAVIQGQGNVTAKSGRDAESEDVEAGVKPGLEIADDLETKEMKTKMLQKPKRVRKPNVRVNGPEWVRK
jgi:hypothetical protein